MKQSSTLLLKFLVTFFLLSTTASSGLAHEMSLDVKEIKPNQWQVKLVYQGDEPAGKGTIEVWLVDPEKKVFESAVDDQGAVLLPDLPPGRYRIVGLDDFGHRATKVVKWEADGVTSEATSTKLPDWAKMALGVGILVVIFAFLFWFSRQKKHPAPTQG